MSGNEPTTTPDASTDQHTVTKAEIRGRIRAARKARRRAQRESGCGAQERADEARRIANAALAHLDASPQARAAGWGTESATVAVFRSTPSEPDTSALLDTLLDRGVRVLVPRTRSDMALDWHELRVRSTPAPGESDVTGDDHGAELPSTDDSADEGPSLGLDAIADITAMILPGLAVDTCGHRLGQGGGCYDRTLPRLRPHTPRAVLLFDDEILTAVPHDEHDQRVPAVITPDAGWRALDGA